MRRAFDVGGLFYISLMPASQAPPKVEYSLTPLGDSLGRYRCQVGVPISHPLASRTSLTWDDLQGEKLMLVREGASPVMDAIRADASAHSGVDIVDAPSFYTLDTFNTCAGEGFLMETLDAWEGVHPGIVTLPMEWSYAVPYGIVCGKEPASHVASFVDTIAQGAPRFFNAAR